MGLTEKQKEILNSLYRATQQPIPKRKVQNMSNKDNFLISTLQRNEKLINRRGQTMMRRIALLEAIGSLNVKKVEAALADCGKDLAVLGKPIQLKDKTVTFLLYPLYVGQYINSGQKVQQEDLRNIKEITEFLWDQASDNVRNSWLEFYQGQQENDTKSMQAPNQFYLNNAFFDINNLLFKDKRALENQDLPVIKLLKDEQQQYTKVGGEKWFEDFIQKVKDYIGKVKSASKRCCNSLIDCCISPVKKPKKMYSIEY